MTDATVTGVVLAGGRARRMEGQDKGLIELAGKPMISYVTEALAAQTAALVINANRNRTRYAALGYPVIADRVGGYAGPLAGIASALSHVDTPLAVTAPCDSPLVPPDLVARLRAGLEEEAAELAVAWADGRMQPVFMLLRRELRESLERYLDGGGRKIDQWFADHRVAVVDFSDRPEAFLNVNTPEERAELEARISAERRAHG